MVVMHYQLPDEVHRVAKTRAAAQGITLRAYILNALLVANGQEAYHRNEENDDGHG